MTDQWFAGKTLQASTPWGPWIATPDELGGSALHGRSQQEPDRVIVRRGVLDADLEVRPAYYAWAESAIPWESGPDGLPRFSGPRQ